MATTSAVSPASLDRSSSRRHQSHSTPSRSHSTRKTTVPPTTDTIREGSSRHRGVIQEILPREDYETSNLVAQTSRRSSDRDRPLPTRTESTRSGSHHHRHSSHRSEMTTSAANGGGPAPIVTPMESRHSGRGKSRTTIPGKLCL
jgi:serine/threonine protein kinase KIN1/2